jgi:hypothetical protein
MIEQDPVPEEFEILEFLHRIHLQSTEEYETNDEKMAARTFKEAVSDTVVAAKRVDGPSQATLAIQKLLKCVKHAKKISRQQVLEIMQSIDMPEEHTSEIGPKILEIENVHLCSRNEHIDLCDLLTQADNQNSPSSPADRLTQQVISHLLSLASRIDINGKASLLPCATTLDRRYLPIIRFLLSCFKPAASHLVED